MNKFIQENITFLNYSFKNNSHLFAGLEMDLLKIQPDISGEANFFSVQ